MSARHPMDYVRGTTLVWRGFCRKGSTGRDLVTSGDRILFAVVDAAEQDIALLDRDSDVSGITLSDDGTYLITVQHTDLTSTVLPTGTQYEYQIHIVEGDTGQRHRLIAGPFRIEESAL